MSSPSKSMLKPKPSGILKKAKTEEDESEDQDKSDREKIDRDKYEEVVFDVPVGGKEPVRRSFFYSFARFCLTVFFKFNFCY